MDELPVEHNPKRGWIATANHMNLPDGYPHALGFEWVLPYRFERIREVMRASERSTIADMVKLQMDYSSTGARRVVALLRGLKSTDPVVQRAIHRLGEWNGSLESSSGMAALFEIWFFRHLARAAMASWVDDEKLLDAVLDEDELYDVFEGSNTEVWISRLEDPGAWRGDEPLESRNRVLLTTLAAAVGETERLLGSDWNGWAWGRLHKATLRHPLSSRLEEDRRAAVDVGPAPRGGSGATVNSTSYSLSDFEQRYGASFRMVVDVGAWDESRAMNSPGQSGDPSSPHYRDLFESWAADETFPLLFNRVSIEAVAERRIVLEPRRL
jgi:penicillin amidase